MEPKLKEQKEKKLCEKGNFECFYRYSSNQDGAKKGTVIICPNAPCKYNKMKFGQHTRIIEFYLKAETWDLAYYYFEDLLPMFHLQCDINEYYKLVKDEIIDADKLPLGCRIFYVSNQLYSLKNQLIAFQELEQRIEGGTITEKMSEKGKSDYNHRKIDFATMFMKNLERLKHMVMDSNTKQYIQKLHHENLIEYYEKSIEAAKAKAISVKPPEILEQGFKDAAVGAGNLTQQHAELNKGRAEKAIKTMERDKLYEELQQYLTSGQEIPQELKEKLTKPE